MKLPPSRGPLSAVACALLGGTAPPPIDTHRAIEAPIIDDDLHLALYLCYELHYRGIEGVDERREWDPEVLRFRAEIERRFEDALREQVVVATSSNPIDVQLRTLITADEGPSASSLLGREGSIEMYREFLMHRSAYQLKEADPHSFAIPRLQGRAKVALMEIQGDEYGAGDPAWMHSALFADTMRALDLDPTENAYVDRLPGVTLATVNLVSLFGLHRRLRGALVGHLAMFEMTSSIPNRRYADGLRRLGYDHDEKATRFFDEHVEADAVHESIAANDLAGSLVEDDPRMESEVLFGAASLLWVEGRWATHVLDSWREGGSSLLDPAAGSQVAHAG